MYKHTPEIKGNLATLAFDIEECPTCGKKMLKCDVKFLKRCESKIGSAGILGGGNTISAQCERAGIVFSSESTDKHDKFICNECEKSGRSSFVCALCNIEQPSSDDNIKESFGYHPEYLCKRCYETVPVKVWDEKCKELENDYMYDYD